MSIYWTWEVILIGTILGIVLIGFLWRWMSVWDA